ncbi:MAG: YebC/PmpR family DNA-binding transcriptional regulator [Phycisphaerae bacterium]|nr:YebC/PmpR family DNA-binding transcriptional regulator [Phycisphaerae bacterium]MDW8261872.1 YebC/PmpR family DNA-binding transcriptional regulator [Phycisphaerales bacterium]
MAGHSHWAKIKRAKSANDAKRGKIWSKIARKIIIAAKAGGGDPAANLQLRYTIEEAKAANMPRDTIEKAIKKGTGELGAENYEAATYEAYAPGGVALLIEALTNNRNRTAPDLRAILERGGGNLAQNGAVAFQFTKCGVITIKTDVIDEDSLMEKALEFGADDVKNEGEVFEVITQPTAFHRVKDSLAGCGIPIEAAEITYLPNTTIPLDPERTQSLLKLIDALEDNDDVQSVSHNAELAELNP